MAAEFDFRNPREGDVLRSERSGASGSLAVAPDEIVVTVKLGFLLMALKPRIESQIHRFLDQHQPA
jgi:putative polyhydroxyalkanoate system protein